MIATVKKNKLSKIYKKLNQKDFKIKETRNKKQETRNKKPKKNVWNLFVCKKECNK